MESHREKSWVSAGSVQKTKDARHAPRGAGWAHHVEVDAVAAVAPAHARHATHSRCISGQAGGAAGACGAGDLAGLARWTNRPPRAGRARHKVREALVAVEAGGACRWQVSMRACWCVVERRATR
jgi:hypothetical protein